MLTHVIGAQLLTILIKFKNRERINLVDAAGHYSNVLQTPSAYYSFLFAQTLLQDKHCIYKAFLPCEVKDEFLIGLNNQTTTDSADK